MSLLIKNYKKKISSSLIAANVSKETTTISSIAEIFSTRTEASAQHKYPTIKSTTATTTKRHLSAASLLLPPAVEAAKLNAEVVVSPSVSSMTKQQLVELTQITSAASLGSGRKVSRTMPSFKIMSYQNIFALLTVLVCGIVTANGLKCYMCGQYNEGVGSITPCLNYSEQYAHLYLKECSKKSEKYCVKYVSELSIVRDCATECAEKEIWETQTYCCTEDGCNGSSVLETSVIVLMLPLAIYVINKILDIMKQQRR